MEKKQLKIFGVNKELYQDIAENLRRARKSIYLETFIFRPDNLGKKIRDILTEKAKANLDIKLIMDGIGSVASSELMFGEFITSGGKLKFFKRPIFSLFLLEQLNFRDHRKVLIIDEKIIYFGSSNIDGNTTHWWEMNVRLENPSLAGLFKKIFLEMYEIANNRRINKNSIRRIEPIDNMELLCGSPSFRVSLYRNKLVDLISRAKQSIFIEMAYAIADNQIMRAMKDAAARGVRIVMIFPYKSDSMLSNIISHEYFAKFHRLGAEIRLYHKNMLHAKSVLIDEKKYVFGSSNLDYRSYFWHFEIDLAGEDEDLARLIARHFRIARRRTIPFNFALWKKRSLLRKVAGKFLYLIRFVL